MSTTHSGPDPAVDVDELLAHLGWVRRLARSLLRGPDDAEDLAQETLRVTLAQPPGRVGGGTRLRGWLAAVARRLALDQRRATSSRRRHEREAAAERLAPSSLDVVARGARQQRVVAAVMQLEEPSRSVVLLRYLDELSTREIAARLQVSEEVVRKRLSRGLARLREELDREFGAPTSTWAMALLPGVVTMSAKTKLLVAAGVVVGSLLTWQAWRGGLRAPRRGPRDVAGLAAAVEATAATRAAPADGLAPPARAEDPIGERRVEPVTRGAPHPGESVVRVRVVDGAGHPCREGLIDCGWSDTARWHGGDTLRTLRRPITDEVTAIRVPARARVANLAASVAGLPASPVFQVDLEPPTPATSADGVERDVTISVGATVDAPRLVGAVFVDGVARVPAGLVIRGDGFSNRARVNAVTAEYALGPLTGEEWKLDVVSEETIEVHADIAPDPISGRLDLHLQKGRTLRLTVVADDTGEPLPGFELFREVSHVVDRFASGAAGETTIFGEHRCYLRTDEQGIAVIAGLPAEGALSIHRDGGRPTHFTATREKGGWTPVFELDAPLWRLVLDPSLPLEIRHTLRVAKEVRSVCISGTVAAELLTPDRSSVTAAAKPVLRHAALLDDGTAVAADREVALATDGAWSFTSDARSRQRVWLERGGVRVSQALDVEVKGSDVDSLELQPIAQRPVSLRLRHAPHEGRLLLFIDDERLPRNFGVDLAAGVAEFTLALERPTQIHLCHGSGTGGVDASQHWETRRIDPARQSTVEIDLHGPGLRQVELVIDGATLHQDGTLLLQGLFDSEGSRSGSSVRLRDGVSVAPTLIAAGRCVVASANLVDGLLLDVIDVPEGAGGAPLAIRCELSSHPRVEVGRGIEVTGVDGVDVTAIDKATRQLRLDDGLIKGDVLWLPARCTFVPLGE